MSEQSKPSRFRKRPLLVATFGVAVVSVAACGGFTSGNLMAPKCPDGGFDTTGNNCLPAADAGTTDGGGKDGGSSDGGAGGDS
ncbi:MAG: hypothetical protein H6Q89_857 [Myxococcaceae bacterium]|nr:hypothetical protein [Myxococcaceae bacterium]